VHIVFAEFERLARQELRLQNAALRTWPRLIHRKIYYRLIIALEGRIYKKPGLSIVCVSRQVAREIALHCQREHHVYVIYNAVDHRVFNPPIRTARREAARREFGLRDEELALLLIGNDWKKKGLHWLLKAVAHLRHLPLKLWVVGRDDREPYVRLIREMEIDRQVRFLEPSSDIVKFYAASDVYVGPSLHDSFALPPLEAMACGLPVITSSRNGGAEIISHGTDGFVLKDPTDVGQLAGLIDCLYSDPGLRKRLGRNAARTACQCTWERNASELGALFEQILARQDSKDLLEREAV
jgi:UDP-glucose:(heptosyl)LPS alpha-1,3-glucosyltransferase